MPESFGPQTIDEEASFCAAKMNRYDQTEIRSRVGEREAFSDHDKELGTIEEKTKTPSETRYR